MKPRRIVIALAAFVVATACVSFANNEREKKPEKKSETKLTETDRENIIRTFMAEQAFVHRMFPMGKIGLRIENGVVTPTDAQVRQLAADYGPACRPGDRAKITAVRFKDNGIIFEINGGPVKRKKWYQRLQISGAGSVAVTPTGQQPDMNIDTNARGSYVALVFKGHVPALTPDEIKQMLSPVLDFKSATVAEAYEKSLPPKLAEAVKDHKALVGMDRDMVTFALGRAPRKIREADKEGTEYEEWIYGQPPQDVQFVRFIGNKVVRIETMSIDGHKVVRTKDEVGDLNGAISAMANKEQPKSSSGDAPNPSAPSLMRPGEQPVVVTPSTPVRPQNYPPPGAPPTNPGSDPGIPDAGQPGIPSPNGPPIGPPGMPPH